MEQGYQGSSQYASIFVDTYRLLKKVNTYRLLKKADKDPPTLLLV